MASPLDVLPAPLNDVCACMGTCLHACWQGYEARGVCANVLVLTQD